MSITVKEVSKNFGNFAVLKNINLEIKSDLKSSPLVALLGPSGSGKSTLLRAIAGLEKPDQGQIIINGQDTTNLPLRKRNIGFVFQHYALFPQMSVRDNIGFGLQVRKISPAKIKARVDELLDLIQLTNLGERYPAQLSGGQRQRVALARALALQPEVLLLDEPFGALDAKIRKELRDWLRNLHDQIKITTLFVTHDQEEAMEIADQIVIMNKGSIEQIGHPTEIYENPQTPFVMSFIGEVNILPNHASLFENQQQNNHRHELFIRPHDIQLLKESQNTTTKATIERIIYLGNQIRAQLITNDGFSFIVFLTRAQFEQLNIKRGQDVFVQAEQAKYFA